MLMPKRNTTLRFWSAVLSFFMEEKTRKDFEAEVKRVQPLPKNKRPQLKRDKTMTGGERGETVAEKRQRKKEARKPKKAPIIQRDVTR